MHVQFFAHDLGSWKRLLHVYRQPINNHGVNDHEKNNHEKNNHGNKVLGINYLYNYKMKGYSIQFNSLLQTKVHAHVHNILNTIQCLLTIKY